MIYELKNFLDAEQLNFINTEIQKFDLPNNQNIKFDSYKEGTTTQISSTKELKCLDDFLYTNVFGSPKLLEYVNRRYLPQYPTGDSGYEFHRYAPGDICHVHTDGEVPMKGQQTQCLLRFASVVLHLNTPSDGAELIFPSLSKTVKTEAGKIVIFPPYGFVPHYVSPSSDVRDVIITWFVYKDLIVVKQ